jgi:acyl-CoA reductase-like NAD-dependent aldehyde dehydrogenase
MITSGIPARSGSPFRAPSSAAALFERLTKHVSLAGLERERIPVRTPYTGEVLGSIPAALECDVEWAIARARLAQPAWAGRPIGERARIFLRFHDLVLQRQEEALDLIQLESGKARRHAFEEVLDTAATTRYYALHAARHLQPHRRKGALPGLTKTFELHSPVGVAGFIVPWNYPLNLAITDAVPAILAGNTAILKPDHQTSFTALWAVALLREVGLPEEVLQVLTGEGPRVGPMLTERVDYLMFTGSTKTGRMIGKRAAERLIGCSLELGGKNPMLVLRDAGLTAAVDGAVRGCFVGAGQVCISIERIYVHETLYQEFASRFAEGARRLRLGAALDYSVDMGTLTSARQLETVEAHVRDALEKGATLLAGGHSRPDLGPYFYEPTILENVREGMRVWDEETFGPVVSLYSFADEEEAIRRANATNYGLSASVWTRDTARGVALASRIRAGSVNVNEAYAAAWASSDAPMGGMKDSGVGRRHGREGLLKFTEPQTIAVQRLVPIAPPFGMSQERWARGMTFLLRLVRRTRILG